MHTQASTGPTRNTSVSVKTYSSQVSVCPTKTQVSQLKLIAHMCNIAWNDAFNSDIKDYSYCMVPQEVY